MILEESMGESVVERRTIESKMGESVQSPATLEVSVSFGRFANDSLSWEKWSSFSPNKYLEEVEKCSTPGSVAQKKAYFEAHYKKIAARKAEQSELEKPMESQPPSSDEPEQKIPVKTEFAVNGEIHLSSNEKPAEDVKPEFSRADGNHITTSGKGKVDNEIVVNSQDLAIKETKDELSGTLPNSVSSDKEETEEELIGTQAEPESSIREESPEVLEESAKESCPEMTEQYLKVNEAKKAAAGRSKSQRLSARYNTQKMTPRKKEHSSAGERKKVASPAIRSSPAASPVIKSSSPAAKLSHFSTSRLTKSTMMPTSQSSTKKVNLSSLPKSKITPGEYRKSGSVSLHMSLSLDPANPVASFTTPRKSLIMEKMGDKDIVRLAFKTFQNSINGLRSSTDGLLSGPKQVSYKGSERKVPNTLTQKENEGHRKTIEKVNRRGHSGNRSNLVSKGLHKGLAADKMYVATVSPSASLRSDARAEKHKELQDKPNMREAERTELGTKRKEAKEAQMKNIRQGINSKASPLPAFNRQKEDKGKMHNQPTSKR